MLLVFVIAAACLYALSIITVKTQLSDKSFRNGFYLATSIMLSFSFSKAIDKNISELDTYLSFYFTFIAVLSLLVQMGTHAYHRLRSKAAIEG